MNSLSIKTGSPFNIDVDLVSTSHPTQSRNLESPFLPQPIQLPTIFLSWNNHLPPLFPPAINSKWSRTTCSHIIWMLTRESLLTLSRGSRRSLESHYSLPFSSPLSFHNLPRPPSPPPLHHPGDPAYICAFMNSLHVSNKK